MKVSFLVLMFFIGVSCYAQYPKGLPSPSSNGWSKVGYSQADSGMIQIQRDTFNAKYPTVIRYLDGNLWQTLGNGARWSALKGSSISAVYAGNGLIKVNDSTLRVDTSSIATRLRVQKGIDSLGGVSVKYADTASMLSKYYNQTAINSRLALKVNYTDTTTMMSGYYRSTNPSGYITSSAITGKVNYTDTSTMLSAYYNKTASDGRFVHLTGDEVVGGNKYFSGRTYFFEHAYNAPVANYMNILADSSYFGFYNGESSGKATFYYSKHFDGTTWASRLYYLPGSDGTLALTSDIPSITGKLNISDTSGMLFNYYNQTAADGRFVHLTGNETIGGAKTFNTRVNVIATNSGDAYILNGMDYSNTYHIAYLGQTSTNTGYLALADNLGNQGTFINGNGYSKINDNTYNAYGVGVGFAADNGSGAKLQVNGGVYASSYVKSGGTSTQYLMADGSVTTAGTTYVPYTGATGAVNLGTNTLASGAITAKDNSTNSPLIFTSATGSSKTGYLYADASIIGVSDVLNAGAGVDGIFFNSTTHATTLFNNGVTSLAFASTGAATFVSTANSNWAATFQNNGTTSAHGVYVNLGSGATGIPFRVDVNSVQKFAIDNTGAATFSGNVGLGVSPLSGGASAKWLTADGTSSAGGGLISSLSGVAKGYYYYDGTYAAVQGSTGIGVALQYNGGTNALTINGSTGAATFSSSVTANYFASITGLSTINIKGTTGSPITISAGAGAGTTPAVSVTGTDLAGKISITTGTTPSASAVLATLTFAVSPASNTYIVLTPANAATAALASGATIYVTTSTTTFILNTNTTALTASTAYAWYYHAIQ